MSSKQRIADRIDALSRALEEAGVPASASERLLDSAALAAAHVFALEQLGRLAPRPVAARERPGEAIVRVLPAPPAVRTAAA